MKTCKHSFKKKLLHKMMNRKGFLFHITGIICIVWFLLRVLPKPDRIRYPCQQMSATIAVGYIAFWGVLWGAIFVGLGLWIRNAKVKTAALTPLFLVLMVLLFSVSTSVYADNYAKEKDTAPIWEPIPNEPIGVPSGANPGRVTWIWDADATQKYLDGFWWEKQNNDINVLDDMYSQGLQKLADTETDTQAWDVLFKHFNSEHGTGEVGYQPGEKIAIKINMNNCIEMFDYSKEDNDRDANPYVIKALLRQLVNVVGVSQEDITIYDASRLMSNFFYHRVFYEVYPSSDLIEEFPNVHYEDSSGLGTGRDKVQPSSEYIYFAHETAPERTLPTCVVDAKYLINVPLLKRHPIEYGVTLSAKNFFGTWIEDVWPVHTYHTDAFIAGNEAPQVDLLSHEHIGGKTLLYIGDGTFPTKIDHQTIAKFQMYPFEDDWTNSLFFSQDPVAIDSVMYDFLHTEGTNPCEGSQNYLHQSAVPNAVSYDPENDGVYLSGSLGVHEHWDKTVDIFSSDRYNGPGGNGIDYVSISNEEESKHVTITKPARNYVYAFDEVFSDFFVTVVIGDITIDTVIEPGTANIEKVDYFLDNELMASDDLAPYSWFWDEPALAHFYLKIKVYFDDDTTVTDELGLWRIL